MQCSLFDGNILLLSILCTQFYITSLQKFSNQPRPTHGLAFEKGNIWLNLFDNHYFSNGNTLPKIFNEISILLFQSNFTKSAVLGLTCITDINEDAEFVKVKLEQKNANTEHSIAVNLPGY